MAPLFSVPWLEKMLVATRAVPAALDPVDYPRVFGGPSVPRKELIYSLVDLKVARIPRDERLRRVSFWIGLLRTWCGEDWLSSGANRAPGQDRIDVMLAAPHWVDTGRDGGLAVGRMVVTLNALAYGLYSDVFVHQCAECRGPYRVPSAGRRELLVRSWSGLWPRQLQPDAQDPGFDEVVIASVYEDCQCSMDIYNHVSWSGSPVEHLRRYAVWFDGVAARITLDELDTIAQRIGGLAQRTFRQYQRLDLEEKKAIWVRQRNYQFRNFFTLVGLPTDAPEMLAAVRSKPLLRSPLWNMTLPKAELFDVWTTCLDPRNEVYADDWSAVFRVMFGDHPRP